MCRFVHGEEGLAQAIKATEALRPGAATALDATTLEAIAGDAPSCSLTAAQVTNVALVDVMVASGMLKSKGEVGAGWEKLAFGKQACDALDTLQTCRSMRSHSPNKPVCLCARWSPNHRCVG